MGSFDEVVFITAILPLSHFHRQVHIKYIFVAIFSAYIEAGDLLTIYVIQYYRIHA